MKNLKISAGTTAKLTTKHNVTRREIEQCFANKAGSLLEDTRALTKTDPPTLWFISYTNEGRPLKVVYMQRGQDVHLKSAFEPNDEERRIYNKFSV